jgi:hypothetical protein
LADKGRVGDGARRRVRGRRRRRRWWWRWRWRVGQCEDRRPPGKSSAGEDWRWLGDDDAEEEGWEGVCERDARDVDVEQGCDATRCDGM